MPGHLIKFDYFPATYKHLYVFTCQEIGILRPTSHERQIQHECGMQSAFHETWSDSLKHSLICSGDHGHESGTLILNKTWKILEIIQMTINYDLRGKKFIYNGSKRKDILVKGINGFSKMYSIFTFTYKKMEKFHISVVDGFIL